MFLYVLHQPSWLLDITILSFCLLVTFVVDRLLLNAIRTTLCTGCVSPYSESVPPVGHVLCFKVTG